MKQDGVLYCVWQDMHEEHALQAFKERDHDRDGFISTLDFNVIIRMLKSHLLTPFVAENLITVNMPRHIILVPSCLFVTFDKRKAFS